MKSAQIASFLLWGVTAFAATGMFLGMPSSKLAPVQPISELHSVSFSTSDMTALFLPSTPVVASIPSHTAQAMKINGIIFSTDSAQSRVLIPSTGGRPKPFAIGSTLPNGGKLIAIEKRRITYELNGERHHVDLPRV